jgi:hypothetical protein
VWLAQDIANDLRLVRGPGGGLWYDAGGVFRSGAENLIADCVRHVLGAEYRANRLSEVLSWCKTLPIEITAAPPDENLLNTANGVLELDTLTLRSARHDERFTYRLPVPWVPSATCPQIEAFVRRRREHFVGDLAGIVRGQVRQSPAIRQAREHRR